MPEGAPINRGLITVSVMLATIMQALDMTIANVALPHMQGSLSAAQDQISWVLTSYIVAAAVATPLTGWISSKPSPSTEVSAPIIRYSTGSPLTRVSCSSGGAYSNTLPMRSSLWYG